MVTHRREALRFAWERRKDEAERDERRAARYAEHRFTELVAFGVAVTHLEDFLYGSAYAEVPAYGGVQGWDYNRYLARLGEVTDRLTTIRLIAPEVAEECEACLVAADRVRDVLPSRGAHISLDDHESWDRFIPAMDNLSKAVTSMQTVVRATLQA